MDEKQEDFELFKLKQRIMSNVSDYNSKLRTLKNHRKDKYGTREISRDSYKFLELRSQ